MSKSRKVQQIKVLISQEQEIIEQFEKVTLNRRIWKGYRSKNR